MRVQWLDGALAPRAEARRLLALVRTDATSLESIRDLITVSPRIEDVLRFYMRTHPEDARGELKWSSAFGSACEKSLTGWWANQSRSDFRKAYLC
jgi:hypothetical protein